MTIKTKNMVNSLMDIFSETPFTIINIINHHNGRHKINESPNLMSNLGIKGKKSELLFLNKHDLDIDSCLGIES